ncbi:two-component system response regulator [Algoriphagus sp.]|uniref:response regulator n=1 Tax=Algoriphagus sp. TaxID=1872435 RepID=UPI00391BD620
MSHSLKRKILVLDDDKIQHLLMRKKLSLMNIDVDLIFFEDVAQALEFIESTPPDVVISDINLNKMDGWNFLEMLKNLNYKGSFFFLSSSIFPDDRNRANEDSFVTDFFEKPIRESDLNYILTS